MAEPISISHIIRTFKPISLFILMVGVWGHTMGGSGRELHDLKNGKVLVYKKKLKETTHPLTTNPEFQLEYPVITDLKGGSVSPEVNEWLKKQVVRETRSNPFKKKYLAATQEAIQEELRFQPRYVTDHLGTAKRKVIDSADGYSPFLYSIDSRLIGYFDDVVMLRVDLIYTAIRNDERRSRLEEFFTYNHVAYIDVRTGETYKRNEVIAPDGVDRFVDQFMRSTPLSPERSNFSRDEVANGYAYWDGSAVVYTVQGGFRGKKVADAGEAPVQLRLPLDSIRPFLNEKGPLAGLKDLKFPSTNASERMYRDFWDGLGVVPHSHGRWLRIHPQSADMKGVRELKIHKDDLLRYRYRYDRKGRIMSRTMYWDGDEFDSTTVDYNGPYHQKIHVIDSKGRSETWRFDERGNLISMEDTRHPDNKIKDSLRKRVRIYEHMGKYTYTYDSFRSKYYCYYELERKRTTYKNGRRKVQFYLNGTTPERYRYHYDEEGRFMSRSSERDGEVDQGVTVNYNANGNPVRIQRGSNNATTVFRYENGRIQKIKPSTSRHQPKELYTFQYNENGRVTQAIKKSIPSSGSEERVYTYRYEYTLWE